MNSKKKPADKNFEKEYTAFSNAITDFMRERKFNPAEVFTFTIINTGHVCNFYVNILDKAVDMYKSTAKPDMIRLSKMEAHIAYIKTMAAMLEDLPNKI
jgi:hypothetical protein